MVKSLNEHPRFKYIIEYYNVRDVTKKKHFVKPLHEKVGKINFSSI